MASLLMKEAQSIMCLLILSAILINMTNARATNVVIMKAEYGLPSASAKNCGKVPFNFTWTPDVLSPFGSVKIKADYVFPHDFSGGSFYVTATFINETAPFIGYGNTFTCKQISKFMPCPQKKGAPFHVIKTFTKLTQLAAYPGDYIVHLDVKNTENMPMLCANAHIVIKES